MTGGTVVVLGDVGRNFGAGMSGGIAYVYDEDGSVELCAVLPDKDQAASGDHSSWHLSKTDESILKDLVNRHFLYTGSQRAREILDDWPRSLQKFVKVFPKEYKQALLKGIAHSAA